MMRAITAREFGEPDVLSITEVPKPVLQPQQLLVKVKAAALNRADLLQRRGKYPPPVGESPILGLEMAGEVAEIGDQVTDYKIGDRVFGLVGSGAYAEYCPIDQKVAWPLPEVFSFVEAAAIPEAFLTANEALFTLGNLQKNEVVLIHAGGSGVGTAAIQLAKNKGATVITTVGSNNKIARVKALGADFVINYNTDDFATLIPTLTSHLDVIIDFVGARYLAPHLDLLNHQGRLICVGLMGGTTASILLDQILRKRLQIKGLVMRTRSLPEKRTLAHHFKETLLPLFMQKQIYPVIDKVFPFIEVAAAHQYMENNTNVGKIVLTTN